MDSFIEDPIDSFVEEKNHEGFLQSAIKSVSALVPQSGQELGDVGKMMFRQLPMARGGEVNPMTMGPLGAGANIGGVKEIGGIPLSTEWGKTMESQVVDPAVLISGGVLGLKRGAQGLGKMMDLGAAKRGLTGAVREGAATAEGSLSRMSQKANEAMGQGLAQIQDTGMTVQSLDDVLARTAMEIDPTGSTHGVAGSMANEVLNLRSGIQGNPSRMAGPELQARFVDLKDRLGVISPKAQAVFNNHFNDAIEFPFADVKNLRSGVYAQEEAARPLTKVGTLNKIGKRTMDARQLGQLEDAASQVPGLEGLIANITKQGKNVGRASALRKTAIGAGALGGGAGILSLIKSMMGGSSNVTNIFQGGE